PWTARAWPRYWGREGRPLAVAARDAPRGGPRPDARPRGGRLSRRGLRCVRLRRHGLVRGAKAARGARPRARRRGDGRRGGRPQRLALAEAAGAERHGNEPVDVAIVCTPRADAIAAAADALAPGGSLCLYAPPSPERPLELDGARLYFRELDVTGSYSAAPD